MKHQGDNQKRQVEKAQQALALNAVELERVNNLLRERDVEMKTLHEQIQSYGLEIIYNHTPGLLIVLLFLLLLHLGWNTQIMILKKIYHKAKGMLYLCYPFAMVGARSIL